MNVKVRQIKKIYRESEFGGMLLTCKLTKINAQTLKNDKQIRLVHTQSAYIGIIDDEPPICTICF